MKNRYHINTFLITLVVLLLGSCTFWQPQRLPESPGMVVAAHPVAADFGYEILLSGGNAIDAAVGTALVLGVVEPNASGLGGGGGILIYLNEPDSLTYINYYARAPQQVAEFNRDTHVSSARAVLVPGTVAGLSQALEQYGTMSWTDIVNRSISKIENGFIVDENLNALMMDSYGKLMNHPQTSSIYLKDLFPYVAGDTLVNQQVLSTLRKLADQGPDSFYSGELADSIVNAVSALGGTITGADLAGYKPVEKSPVRSKYRDYTLISAPPPQSGITLLEILNIIEFKNISAMGNFNGNSATFHFIAEAMKRGYADRMTYLSDPNFMEVPEDVLLSDEYAEIRYATIDMDRADPAVMEKTEAGDVQEFLQQNYHEPIDKDGSTTHISVVDRHGNAVSLTQTLNHFWGSGITVAGFLLNNGMMGFSDTDEANTNTSAPGRQPRSTITPTMLFSDGDLFMVVGSPGAGRIISTLVEIICNIIDFGMTPDQANQAPRFCSRKSAETLPVESRFDQALLDDLISMGHPIEVLGEMDNYFGGVHMIVVYPNSGMLKGSADPRRSGAVAGGI